MTYMFAIYNNIIYYLVCGQLGTWYYIIRFTDNINDEKKNTYVIQLFLKIILYKLLIYKFKSGI